MLKWSTDYFMAAHKSGGLTMSTWHSFKTFILVVNTLNLILWDEILLDYTQPYPLASDCEFVGQIGNGGVDHGFWGRPEEMTMNRFLLLMNILSFKIPANLAGLLIQHLKIWSFLTLSNVAGLHTAFPVTTLAPIWRVGLQLTFTGIFALDFFMCNFLSFC